MHLRWLSDVCGLGYVKWYGDAALVFKRKIELCLPIADCIFTLNNTFSYVVSVSANKQQAAGERARAQLANRPLLRRTANKSHFSKGDGQTASQPGQPATD